MAITLPNIVLFGSFICLLGPIRATFRKTVLKDWHNPRSFQGQKVKIKENGHRSAKCCFIWVVVSYGQFSWFWPFDLQMTLDYVSLLALCLLKCSPYRPEQGGNWIMNNPNGTIFGRVMAISLIFLLNWPFDLKITLDCLIFSSSVSYHMYMTRNSRKN